MGVAVLLWVSGVLAGIAVVEGRGKNLLAWAVLGLAVALMLMQGVLHR